MFAATDRDMVTRREATRAAFVPNIMMLVFVAFVALTTMGETDTAIDPGMFPPLEGRVVDRAQVLDAAGIDTLNAISRDLEQKTQAQLVVATIPDLQGHAIEDYGYQLGRTWQIGRKDINDGVILLVAPNERAVRIEVGYGLEGALTDAQSRMIIEQDILPPFREGQMQNGIIAGARQIAAIAAQSGVAMPSARPLADDAPAQGDAEGWIFTILLAFFGLIPAFGIGQFVWARVNSAYGDRLVPRPRRGGWGGPGGGPWGGGGSSGGGFRGRGGSFGGGGASGRW